MEWKLAVLPFRTSHAPHLQDLVSVLSLYVDCYEEECGVTSKECIQDFQRMQSLRRQCCSVLRDDHHHHLDDKDTSTSSLLHTHHEYLHCVLTCETTYRMDQALPHSAVTTTTTTTHDSHQISQQQHLPLQWTSALTQQSHTVQSLTEERATILWNLACFEAQQAVQKITTATLSATPSTAAKTTPPTPNQQKAMWNQAAQHFQTAASWLRHIPPSVKAQQGNMYDYPIGEKIVGQWDFCAFLLELWQAMLVAASQQCCYEAVKVSSKTRPKHVLLAKLAASATTLWGQVGIILLRQQQYDKEQSGKIVFSWKDLLNIIAPPSSSSSTAGDDMGATVLALWEDYSQAYHLYMSSVAEYHQAMVHGEKKQLGIQIARLNRSVQLVTLCSEFCQRAVLPTATTPSTTKTTSKIPPLHQFHSTTVHPYFDHVRILLEQAIYDNFSRQETVPKEFPDIRGEKLVQIDQPLTKLLLPMQGKPLFQSPSTATSSTTTTTTTITNAVMDVTPMLDDFNQQPPKPPQLLQHELSQQESIRGGVPSISDEDDANFYLDSNGSRSGGIPGPTGVSGVRHVSHDDNSYHLQQQEERRQLQVREETLRQELELRQRQQREEEERQQLEQLQQQHLQHLRQLQQRHKQEPSQLEKEQDSQPQYRQHTQQDQLVLYIDRFRSEMNQLLLHYTELANEKTKSARAALATAHLPQSLTAFNYEHTGGGMPPLLWEKVNAIQVEQQIPKLKQALWELRDKSETSRSRLQRVRNELESELESDRLYRQEHPGFQGRDVSQEQRPFRVSLGNFERVLDSAQEGDTVILQRLEQLNTNPKYKMLQFPRSQLDRLLSTSNPKPNGGDDDGLPAFDTSRLSQYIVDLSTLLNNRDALLHHLQSEYQGYDIKSILEQQGASSLTEWERAVQLAISSFDGIINDVQSNIWSQGQLMDHILAENDNLVRYRSARLRFVQKSSSLSSHSSGDSCLAVIEDAIEDVEQLWNHLKEGTGFYDVLIPKIGRLLQEVGDSSARLTALRLEYEDENSRHQQEEADAEMAKRLSSSDNQGPVTEVGGAAQPGHPACTPFHTSSLDPFSTGQLSDGERNPNVAALMTMGFDRGKIVEALERQGNDMDLALNELLK